MAIYHLSVKTVGRSSGRSATAAAAYRAAQKIVDERTGEIHDYTHKQGVVSQDIVAPPGAPAWTHDRQSLWNAAEQSETRINSTVAREFEIALPDELNAPQRRNLALQLAQELVARHGFIADVCIHQPSKAGDERNHHAHILCTTRRIGVTGFAKKTRELDDLKTGEIKYWRERFAILQNQHLREAGISQRVDHRSHEERGIPYPPGVHLGPQATNYERRTGKDSRRRIELEQEQAERHRSHQRIAQRQTLLQTELADTHKTLHNEQQLQLKTEAGRSQFRQKFAAHQQAEQELAQQQAKAQERQQQAQRQAQNTTEPQKTAPKKDRGKDRGGPSL